MPSTEASVRMPRPPTWMPAVMTEIPKSDQYSSVTTGLSPVTQTAETATKTEFAICVTSSTDPGWRMLAGSMRRIANSATTATKDPIASRAGEATARSSTKSRTHRPGVSSRS